MSEFTDELKRLDLAINLPSKTYFAIEENFKDWQPPKPLVVVPQFMVDWFEDNKHDLEYAIYILHVDFYARIKSDIYWWYKYSNGNAIETLIRMKLEGYTVKKEQLYEVVFYVDEEDDRCLLMKTGKTISFEYESQNEGHYQQQFTEAEIKEIDERYWTFSVPVEEVEP